MVEARVAAVAAAAAERLLAAADDEANQALSEKRAAAVKAYLEDEFDIDGGRLEARGLGESRPVADNGNPEGRQQNRRVELVRI